MPRSYARPTPRPYSGRAYGGGYRGPQGGGYRGPQGGGYRRAPGASHRGAQSSGYRGPGQQPNYSRTPANYYGRARSWLDRYGAARRHWGPSQQWNNTFANRLGWNRHAGRISSMIGCPGCSPGSWRFSNSLARWQSRLGLRPTGVLTPGLWGWMRRRIGSPWLQPGAGATPPPLPQPPDMQPPPPPMGSAPPPAPEPPPPADDAAPAEPPPDAPPDAPPEAPPPDEPAAPVDDAAPAEEYGYGFRRRRFHPGQHAYQGAQQSQYPQRPRGRGPRRPPQGQWPGY